jgi:D-glycero-D-manno-heptose 1,7-bisphosphate phosphatase
MNSPCAVFLDRDGTLIEEREYLSRPDEVVLYPGAAAALRRLRDNGFRTILITNQSGVSRGYFTMDDVAKVNAHLESLLAQEGAALDAIYVAPEAPDQPSRGRKPSPQFLFDSRDAFNLDLAQCFMIGDKMIDLECGWNAGVKTSILVRTGYGRKHEASPAAARAVVVDGLPAAVEWILNNPK